MNDKSLFELWLTHETKHKSQVDVVNELNIACGTKYKKSWPQIIKLREYSLERTPIKVRRHMMKIVLPTLLDISEVNLDKLINNLT